ncbi:ribonuclease Z [Paenibacillus antri]|uniref:Ribonuclease Z n=1 Tax=Paenibacillus antri TaxID=2582848 RepID=A0A5R9G706_9BACL|nr:ribonuclease Z [Paenibacillus antri]TLS50156.1 ribonuclease Z [Paenibacillus antri]
MELYFLGTGAGMPTRGRNVTSVALNLMPERGTVWLFDAGEGTQHQMLRSPIKPGKLEFIFITHLHGDHLYGLPGLMTSRSYQGGDEPLTLFGPPGLRRFVETAFEVSGAHLDYEVRVREFEEGVVFEDEQFRVTAAKLEHRIDSYGFRIVERDTPGALDSARLTAEGFRPGPQYARLKRGETVTMPDGRTIDGRAYLGPELKGRTVAVFGDTRPCGSELELARGADVLVHEATYMHEKADNAHKYYHTTATQAAVLAAEAGVGALILTHLSSRYQDEAVHRLLEEARAIFPRSHVAEDFWSYVIPRRAE